MEELKPCPFCGGEAKLWYCTADGKHKSNEPNIFLCGQLANHKIIVCSKCGAQTKVFSSFRVFKAWNRRVERGM